MKFLAKCGLVTRNKTRVNDKRSFIDSPYLLLATRFVYNYTHYQAISVTIFFRKKTVSSGFIKALWSI